MASLSSVYINRLLAKYFSVKSFRIKRFKALQSKPTINSSRSPLMELKQEGGDARPVDLVPRGVILGA